MTTLEGVDRLGRLYDWTAEERDHVAALIAEARDTFAAADSEQRRLAEWVLANCPGEPSQDGGVVDTVIRLITSARADGAAEERERIERAITEEMPEIANGGTDLQWRASREQRAAFRVALECVNPGQS